jgi:hypothetical protein
MVRCDARSALLIRDFGVHLIHDSRFPSLPFVVIVAGCLLLTALPRTASARPKDAAALGLATDAMSGDFANSDYAAARKKLQRALKRCGKRGCSREVRGKLYRNLGVVYWILGKKKQARGAFEKALKLDPSVRLEPDWETPALSAAFQRAGGEAAEPEPESEAGEGESEDSSSSEHRRRKRVGSRSWLSLSVQQDWLFMGETHPVCGSAEYTCFAGDTEYTGPIWPAYGNRVSGGLTLATTRVLLGFEQVLGDNFALGLRLGLAFRGGPSLRGGEKFLPVHAELRAAYYIGNAPFAKSGVRPYLALGGGLGELRGRINIDFYRDAEAYNRAQKQTLDAWRRTGPAFVAPTVGAQFAFSRTFALTLELRWMVLLGVSGSAPAASIGFAQGL